MRIMVTGPKGIGKTTICERIISQRKRSFGFLTHPILREGRRVGFYLVDIKTHERKLLASENSDGPKLGRYFFSPEGIAFGIRALKRSGDLCVVDELGRLELEGEGFYGAIPLLRERKNLIVTTRSDFAQGIIELFEVEFRVFEITIENREIMGDYASLIK